MEDKYKNYYEMKEIHKNYIDEKKNDLKKKSKHIYPNGEKYVNNWKQKDIVTIEKLRNLKGLCLNCKKPGMIFMDSNRELIAKCGNQDDCGYNLKIEINEFKQIDELIETLTKDNELIKEKIIIWKLNLLYKLDVEDVVLREFDILKTKLQYNTKLLKVIKDIKMKKDQLMIEEAGENIPISRKNLLNKLSTKIIKKKEDYKNIIKNYINNNLNDNSIQEAMILHKEIMEDIKKHRDIKYELGNKEVIQILHEKGHVLEYQLYEKEKNYENLEYEFKNKYE